MISTIYNIDTYWEAQGDESKQPILFLHGWGGTHKSLKDIAELLGSKYYCILIDLPGFGKSSNPPSTWGVEEYASFLKEYIDSLKLSQPPIVIGHSFGGALALSLAAQHPSVVQKLVVCAPSWHRKRRDIQAGQKYLLKKIPLLRKIVYKIFFPQSDLLKYPQLEENFKRIMTEDLSHLLPHITQKVLILWGDEDTYVPVTDAHLLHKHLPTSQLEIFPEYRHNLPIKHPRLIEKSVLSFLAT